MKWRGHLSHLLPKRAKLTRGHHAAMAYRDVPAFIAQLRECNAIAAMALEFCILTATRSGEVYGARDTRLSREVAIKQNDKVCVTMPDGSHMSLRLSNCAGTAWTGPGTDAAGTINLPPGFTITPLTSVTFDYLGAADGAQTYTMTNSTTGGTMTFSIALTGRVTGCSSTRSPHRC